MQHGAVTKQLARQTGGGELSDFLVERDEGAEKSSLRPLDPTMYPGTQDIEAVFSGGLGGDFFKQLVGGVISAYLPVPPPPPPPPPPVYQAPTPPSVVTSPAYAAMLPPGIVALKKGVPTWAWIAMGGTGALFLTFLAVMSLKK